MMSPASMLSCLLIPRLKTCEQSNPGGNTLGSMGGVAGWVCCWFLTVLRPNGFAANSASETPASTIRTPSKTRGLKKAECEADFFFMGGYDVDRSWSVKRHPWLKAAQKCVPHM